MTLILVSAFLVACEAPESTETAAFEAAEVAYRRGDYKRALDGYQSFLKNYPESPLAEVADMRMRTIQREVKSMLGRTDSPRPTYRPPPGGESFSE